MIFCFDEFELDGQRLELRRGPVVLKADPLVLRLLAVLLRHAGRLVTKDELVAEVWEGRSVPDNVITVSMARLRKTLGDQRGDRPFVVTVYGRGYRFERPVSTRTRHDPLLPTLSESRPPEPPFVGRTRVLERMRKGLAEAYGGHGRACLLLGEPGIGKTRVVDQLEQELASTPTRIAWGFCREGSDTPPLLPWLRVLRKVYESIPRDEWSDLLGSAASELDRLLDEGIVQLDAGAQPGLNSAAWIRTFESITRALTYASERTPWLLVLDDLHRADAASLELLAHLLDELAHMRVLIVATVRSAAIEYPARTSMQLQYVLGHRNGERIYLEPLGEQEVRAYVAKLLVDTEGHFGRAIYAKSEGNPFLMTELAKQLASEESPDPEALAVPDAALDIVRQRFGKLDQTTRSMLSIAAVLGRSFEVWLLQAVSEREASAIMSGLDEAISADLVVAAPDSNTGFAFSHELLRVVLYDALPRAEQRRCHLRTARALEQRMASTGEPIPPSTLAYHFHAAMPETDLDKTVSYCQRAATAATSVYANADVARYLRQALEALALTEKPSLPLRMQLLMRIAVHRRARANVFVPTILEVVRLARTLNDGATMVFAGALYLAHPELVHVPGGAEVLREALDLLPKERIGLRAVGLGALACAAPNCYDAERAEGLIDEAARLAQEAGSVEAMHVVLLYKLHVRGLPRADGSASEVREQLEALARSNLSRVPMVPLYIARYHAIRALQEGDAQALGAALDSSGARARQLNHPEMLWHCERARAVAQINAGSWAEPIKTLSSLHQQAARLGILGTETFCAFDRLVIMHELGGDAATLDDAARKALAYDAADPPSIWSLKLRALYAAGLHHEVRASLDALTPAALAALPRDNQYLGTLGHLARVVIGIGAHEYAQTLYGLLAPHRSLFAGQVSMLCEGSVAQLMGMLASMLNRSREAVSLLEDGVLLCDRARLPLAAADARLALAHSLRHDPRERARVVALASEVHALAQRLGLTRLARSASSLLRGDGALEAARPIGAAR